MSGNKARRAAAEEIERSSRQPHAAVHAPRVLEQGPPRHVACTPPARCQIATGLHVGLVVEEEIAAARVFQSEVVIDRSGLLPPAQRERQLTRPILDEIVSDEHGVEERYDPEE